MRVNLRLFSVSGVWVAGFLLVIAGSAFAVPQAGQNAVERSQDRKELRQDRRKLRDDAKDLRRIERISDDFAKARASGDMASVAEIDRRVLTYLAVELGETAVESAQMQAELRRDRREIRSDRREIRRNRAMDAPPRAKVDDRRDLRDDRRDLRDDRRDAAGERGRRKRLVEIRKEWKALGGSADPESLAKRAQLLEELRKLARREQVENRKEIREDRRELREDRSETREDRRQP